MAERPVMYLEYEDWSPRYQDTFYTVRLEQFELFTSPPKAASQLPPNHLGSKTNFPAYYYKIEVFCGRHQPNIIYRRYSQFKWLYENLPKSSDSSSGFPPGSGCLFFVPQTETFVKSRKEDLKDFLDGVLSRREVASNEIVAQFLELDAFLPASHAERQQTTKITSRRILYCLDFDGVLCDSVHETFWSGWRACKLLWQQPSHPHSPAYDWISELDQNPQRLQELQRAFSFVRPILYVGWEAILLIRLLAVGYHDPPNGEALSKEDVFQGFHAAGIRDQALQAWGLEQADYKAAMARARNEWIASDETSWMDAHGFYVGACTAVRNYLRQHGNQDVYVITTKAKEFALKLLGKQNLFRSNGDDNDNGDNTGNNNDASTSDWFFRESQVFGLGSGPKASVLEKILQTRQAEASSNASGENFVAVMVEDNIATLDKISGSSVGSKVLPVVASWGYNTVEQLGNVLKASGQNQSTFKTKYLVLPLIRQDDLESLEDIYGKIKDCDQSLQQMAQTGKERDPTGCSLAWILPTPQTAENLLPTRRTEPSSSNICQNWFDHQ